MITPGYGLTSTERVLPRLALDFTTASLDARVTVTRALNTATCVNSLGYIATVNANLPRFDYDPANITACRGLLIEEARTNLYGSSETLDNGTYWANAARNTADSGVISPTGGSSWKHTIPSGTSSNFSQGVTVAASATTTYSVLARAGSVSQINFREANYTGFTVTFTLTGNGTATSGGVIKPWANGWYLCSLPFGYGVGQTSGLVTMGISGVAGDYAYFACPQVELGAFATSYIPTTTTSLTRNADVVDMTGTNFSDWYNATEGTFVLEYFETGINKTAAGLIANAGAYTDVIGMYIDGSIGVPIQPNFVVLNSNSIQANILDAAPPANSVAKMVAAYKQNSFAFALNGLLAGTDASGTIPTVNQLQIGNELNGIFANRHFAKVSYFPQRLTNAEVQAFSK
jgi:hypothetical protein